ncbi:serine protease 27-like [Hyla sarda]|uniref:serine protease 27-like n=1 Tax=Hyla sarda TaxID=327740 RepID=UPI0024C452EC|nr:serine protease 27-like [Hyla sarda]
MLELLVLLTLLSQHGCSPCSDYILADVYDGFRPGLDPQPHECSVVGVSDGFCLDGQRIVGGADSTPGQWPWQVCLLKNGLLTCGGSLIADSWVLTAAHCFRTSMTISDYTIYLGVHQLSDLQQLGIVVSGVKQIKVHPEFNEELSGRDIALVELEEPVIFTSSIVPVSLPLDSGDLPEGTLCWATGWGEVKDGEPLANPKTLQEVQLALIDSKNCESMYQSSLGYKSKLTLIQEDMLCAGYKEGKKDSCMGDSGGPLVCNVDCVWVQIGISSWGFGCAEPNRPGVYTRVTYYLPWIQEHVTSLLSETQSCIDDTI